MSPVEHAHLFTEGIAQLPGSVFCWSPVDDYPIPEARQEQEPVVFGSFNNIMKLSPRTISLWSELLRSIPEAQLLLKAPSLRDQSVIDRFRSLFAAQGIAPERLLFEGPEELGLMMQRYGAIDLAIDPTPYNGGTTTLQALWMGVPVISLRGGNFVSRMGASFLTSLGHPEWVADSESEFIQIAKGLVEQISILRKSRQELRNQMATSGLSNLDQYACDFEALIQQMWRDYCEDSNARLLAG